MHELKFKNSIHNYSIIIGNNTLSIIQKKIKKLCPKTKKIVLIIDTKVKYLWFFLKSEDVLKLGISKISGVKVSTVKSFFIFRSTVVTIYASGVNEQVAYQVKVSYNEIKDRAESWLK